MTYSPPTRSTEVTRRALLRTGTAALASSVPQSASAKPANSAGVNLGVNLAAVRYWGSERPFNNLFLASSPHVSLRTGGKWNQGGALDLDVDGWIKTYQPQQYSAFVIDMGRGMPNVDYRVSYRGVANAIRIARSRDNRRFIKSKDRQRLLVNVHSPIRDVRIQEANNDSKATFADEFQQRCERFRVLRFMDWTGTNEDRAIEWQTRVTPKYYTQAGPEVALEYLIELCNLSDSGMWYCVHHRADDDYVRHVAATIKQHLKPTLSVYVEHSNEVWNGQFPQFQYCRERSPKPLQYHVNRTAEIGRLFRAHGIETQCVLGLHSAATWISNEALKRGVPDDIDATAIAPYFGGLVGRKPEIVDRVLSGGVDAAIQECRNSITERRQEVERHREIAEVHGLQLLGYEGGQHLVAVGPHRRNPRLSELLMQTNRDARMYDLYRDYLNMWRDTTDNAMMCLYNSCGEFSKVGSWGLMEYDAQPLKEAPKYRAVLDALAR